MNNHTFGLIDNQDIRIFIEDIQRDRFRKDVRLAGIRNLNRDLVPFTKLIVGLYGLFSHFYVSFFHQPLNIRTGKLFQFAGKESVDPFTDKFPRL